MTLNKYLFACIFLMVSFVSCDKEEDDTPAPEPPRDRKLQEVSDQAALKEYLDSHFYNYEAFATQPEGFDFKIRIDTIDAANADKIPLSESPDLETITVKWAGVDYKMYVLKAREGVGPQPKFTDSTFVSYTGHLLNSEIFDSSIYPVWFDLTSVIPGFGRAISAGFKGASGFTPNADNTVKWNNDYGIGAVFLPSGIGYFNNPTATIPAYSPLIFKFNLYGANETDHDGDGLPSWMEDLNADKIIENDDTDTDNRSNFFDTDDDGDFIPTREEIEIAEDGSITLPDADGDGSPDYLDTDYVQ